ncbi:MAG: hypothetical protein H7Z76_11920 [Methylotenera sp.]|nr:hypothetical protein [Flavobacterium sp.]
MKIIIHQSLCGERKKEWSLLETTLSDSALANKIAFNTGLHDQVGGTTWLPTVRGFIQDDFYLVMKTYTDTSPDVRPRRAFSHVLMIEKEKISLIHDLAALFTFFPIEMDKTIPIKPIQFDTNTNSELLLPDEFQGRFNKVIHGYRKAKEFKDTIIWVGEQDFHLAIFKFWKILTIAEKANLNFGIYFNTEVIPKQGLNFITTPETIEDKFINHGYFVVRKNDTLILTDIVDQYIAEEEKVRERVEEFQKAIEVKKITRQELDRIIIGINSFEEFETLTDLKKLVSLAHIVAEFSPTEQVGHLFKRKLLHKICLLSKKADVSEFTIVRTFPIKSFCDAELILSEAINSWIENNMFSYEASKEKNYILVFTQLAQTTTSSWWIKIFKQKINAFLKPITSENVLIVYNWLRVDFNIFSSISLDIDNSTISENHFSSQLPSNFNKADFKVLKAFSANRHWYNFHATLLIAEFPFEIASLEQLKIDTSLNSLDGIKVLINNINSKRILDFAVVNGDERFIKIAGHCCKEDSELLNRIDFSKGNWLAVLSEAISTGLNISDGFKEPQEKIFKLFDHITEGQLIPEIIWENIADSEFANILTYKNREKFWNKVSSKFQSKFLAKTSASLLGSLYKNSTIEIPKDEILFDYIIKHAIGDFLFYNPIKHALPIFNNYPTFPQDYIAIYISNYTADISAIEATQLGKLVYSRSYKEVAENIYYKATKNNNWKFALVECHYLLGFYDKAVLAFSGILKTVNITADQWWESAKEIICDFYPNGVSLTTVWKKSGGKESELLISTTAENVWHDALSKLRNKGFTKITMNDLLKEINKSYGENEKFKLIYQLRKNYISD